MSDDTECEYSCPHCGETFSLGRDAQYIDNVADECETQCSECGGRYQLRCVWVEITMEAIAVESSP